MKKSYIATRGNRSALLIARVAMMCLLISSWVERPASAFSLPGSEHPYIPNYSQENTPTLEYGRPIERPLAGGETHTYRIALEAGQFIKATIDQRGIDVLIRLY